MAKILGISTSPRHQATEFAVKLALEAAAGVSDKIETMFISTKGMDLKPCFHCEACAKLGACVRKDDMNDLLQAFLEADGVIIGSPVYSYNPTPETIMIFNRMRMWRNNFPAEQMYRKVGAALSVGGTRNGGQEMTTNAILNMYLARGMLVIGGSSGYYSGPKFWTDNKNQVGAEQDEWACRAAADLGVRMADTVLMIKGE